MYYVLMQKRDLGQCMCFWKLQFFLFLFKSV